jgi:hypothetical protein
LVGSAELDLLDLPGGLQAKGCGEQGFGAQAHLGALSGGEAQLRLRCRI